MSRIEKTVFISYRRRGGSPWALAVAQNLTQHGYDVFFDYKGIASGDFEQVILENIRARAHFLVLLTPSALDPADEPSYWLRKEIETALEHRRNVVPLMLEGFDFATPSMAKYLTGTLGMLKNYNGLTVSVEYFDEAMNRLRAKHLHVPIETVLHAASAVAKQAAAEQRVAAATARSVTGYELTAQRWFERAFEATDLDTQLSCYTQAIELKPDLADAYSNRGIVRRRKGDLAGALADYDEAIRLKPDLAAAYSNRALARVDEGDVERALADYDAAIRLKPDFALAYNNRGLARSGTGDVDGALADYDEAIRLDADFAKAYNNRALARTDKGNHDGAMADYAEAIRLNPDFAEAYLNRGVDRGHKGDVDGALADYAQAIRLKPYFAATYYHRALLTEKRDPSTAVIDYQMYLDLGGGLHLGDQAEIENKIRGLRKELQAQAENTRS
jgi:tetratricopeptide (TPR) repeat protein